MQYVFKRLFTYFTLPVRNEYILNTNLKVTSITQIKLVHCISPSSFVSVSHIKKCLLSQNIVFHDGYTCLSLQCPMCKTQGKNLFINKVSGYITCNHCKRSGNWEEMEDFLFNGTSNCLEIDKNMLEGENEWNNIVKNVHPVARVNSKKILDVLESCDLEALEVGLLEKLDAYLDVRNSQLFLPLKKESHIVGYKRLQPKCEEITLPAQKVGGIIVMDNKSDTAILVENLLDFFTLASHPIHQNIICLPHGQRSLPQDLLPLFEDYNNIILWFGNITSWKLQEFSRKLNEQRCLFVKPDKSYLSPYLAVKNGCKVQNILKEAQPICHQSITTFSQLRDEVLAEILNIDKVSGIKWCRFPQLNVLLKGHRRGELTVLTGPTGSGKTTFMSEYSLDLAMSGVTTLWGSFELRNQRLAKVMLHQYVGKPLEENLDKFNIWADEFERLPIYFMTYYGQQTLPHVLEAVEHATYVHDIAHVIIDNVQFMLGLSDSSNGYLDRFYRQDSLIASFRNFATKHNVHVTLIIHPRKEKEGEYLTASSIFGGAKASQEADNILIIQRITLQSLKVKTSLQVTKNRFKGDLGSMSLEFDKTSLSFAPKKENISEEW